MKYLFTLLILSVLLSACSSIADMPQKPGACYIKVKMPTIYETFYDSVVVYTGNEPEKYTDTLLIKPERKAVEWQKKKADKNCISVDPEDCLVWCLVEVSDDVEKLVTVDTLATRDYAWKTTARKKVIDEGGYMEWHETVCGNKISPELNSRMQQKLIAFGYDIGREVPDGQWDKDCSVAMQYFTEDNTLPSGSDYLLVALGALGLEEYSSQYENFLSIYSN